MSAETYVCLTRNGEWDPRAVFVPLPKLRGVHIATRRGGDNKKLKQRQLACYVDIHEYPSEWRSGKHADRPSNSIKLLIDHDNPPAVLDALRERAANFKPCPRYLRRSGLLGSEA